MWYFALTYAASPEIAATDAAAAVASILTDPGPGFLFFVDVGRGCERGTGSERLQFKEETQWSGAIVFQSCRLSVLLLAEFGANKIPRSSQFSGSCETRSECGGDLARRTFVQRLLVFRGKLCEAWSEIYSVLAV